MKLQSFLITEILQYIIITQNSKQHFKFCYFPIHACFNVSDTNFGLVSNLGLLYKTFQKTDTFN